MANDNDQGQERYPSVRQDDAVEDTGRTEQVTGQSSGSHESHLEGTDGETRSFDPSADAPTPQGENDDTPHSANEGRLGPGGDPVEGAR